MPDRAGLRNLEVRMNSVLSTEKMVRGTSCLFGLKRGRHCCQSVLNGVSVSTHSNSTNSNSSSEGGSSEENSTSSNCSSSEGEPSKESIA